MPTRKGSHKRTSPAKDPDCLPSRIASVMSGAKKGPGEDPADVASIKTSLFRQSGLIGYFPRRIRSTAFSGFVFERFPFWEFGSASSSLSWRSATARRGPRPETSPVSRRQGLHQHEGRPQGRQGLQHQSSSTRPAKSWLSANFGKIIIRIYSRSVRLRSKTPLPRPRRQNRRHLSHPTRRIQNRPRERNTTTMRFSRKKCA